MGNAGKSLLGGVRTGSSQEVRGVLRPKRVGQERALREASGQRKELPCGGYIGGKNTEGRVKRGGGEPSGRVKETNPTNHLPSLDRVLPPEFTISLCAFGQRTGASPTPAPI